MPTTTPIWQALLHFILEPSTLIAVIPMLLFSVWTLSREAFKRTTHPLYFALLAISLSLSPFFSFWDIKETASGFSGGLHIWFFAIILFNVALCKKKYFISLPMFVTLSFLSVFIVDVMVSCYPHLAVGLGHTSPEVYARADLIRNYIWWFDGIGGAGFSDALFIAPIVAAFSWWCYCNKKVAPSVQATTPPIAP